MKETSSSKLGVRKNTKRKNTFHYFLKVSGGKKWGPRKYIQEKRNKNFLVKKPINFTLVFKVH
ncbi:hypothetical protein CMV37_34115 [Bacillus cereus]|nr:hypothetical protein CMV37_34115 [Bacillus cereus]